MSLVGQDQLFRELMDKNLLSAAIDHVPRDVEHLQFSLGENPKNVDQGMKNEQNAKIFLNKLNEFTNLKEDELKLKEIILNLEELGYINGQVKNLLLHKSDAEIEKILKELRDIKLSTKKFITDKKLDWQVAGEAEIHQRDPILSDICKLSMIDGILTSILQLKKMISTQPNLTYHISFANASLGVHHVHPGGIVCRGGGEEASTLYHVLRGKNRNR